MPSLLQRTNAITKRVLESNHPTTMHMPSSTSPINLPKPAILAPPVLNPSEEPLWRQQSRSLCEFDMVVLQKKEEEQLYAKGFRK